MRHLWWYGETLSSFSALCRRAGYAELVAWRDAIEAAVMACEAHGAQAAAAENAKKLRIVWWELRERAHAACDEDENAASG